MTRFVTYDPEVAARLAQAVGVHRVELRDAAQSPKKANAVLLDAVRSPQPSAVLMPSSDEQVLMITMAQEEAEPKRIRSVSKRKKFPKPQEIKEVGTQPSGFLGLHDEPVFSQQDEEEPPRSLWKNNEE